MFQLFLFFTLSVATLNASAASFVFDHLNRGDTEYPTTLKAQESNSKTLSVIWWNTREGGRLSKKFPGNPLEENLQALAESQDAPEVLILGEFMPGSLDDATEAALDTRYSHRAYFPYGQLRPEMGIQIYSRYRFTAQSELLDWSGLNQSAKSQQEFKHRWRNSLGEVDRYYERVFVDVKIQKGSQVFHVLPVHLLNPWLPISSRMGKTKAGLVMMFGQDNPHFRQLERLILEKVKPILNRAKREKSGLVLIGDFNLPDELYGVSPIGFELVTTFLSPSVFPFFSLFTFPAVSSDMTDQPRLRIDHAFVNRQTWVNENERIPLRGSDHYPIGVKVKVD